MPLVSIPRIRVNLGQTATLYLFNLESRGCDQVQPKRAQGTITGAYPIAEYLKFFGCMRAMSVSTDHCYRAFPCIRLQDMLKMKYKLYDLQL